MKLSTIWNHDDFLNAILIVSIVEIIWLTINPYFDYDFANYWNQPYGILWFILNPLFQNFQLYRLQVTLIQIPVVALQFWLVKKKKLSKELVVLTLFITMLFRLSSTDQNVSVVMFAPFVELNPLFTLMVILQKFGLGWSWNLSDGHWTGFIAQITNPRFHPGWNGTTFVLPYYLLAAWTVIPLLFWFTKWRKTDNFVKRYLRKRANKKYFEGLHCGDCMSVGCEDDNCHCCNGGKPGKGGKNSEFHLPEWLWNKDAERGVILGLVASLILVGIFGTNDTSLLIDIKNGVLPYGVLWTWMNPWWWTQQPYMVSVTAIEGVMYLGMWKLVKMGRLSKDLVIMNLFTNVFLNATHVFQEGTVIMVGPLIAASPNIYVTIGLAGVMILQKFPIGWSWNFQDPHVQCGIFGHCIAFDNSRLDIARSDFFTHLALIFWLVAPLMLYWKKKTGRMPFQSQMEWVSRHWKILLILSLTFMICLTIYGYYRNGGQFWSACVGYNNNDTKPSYC
jgi:hypothetical protein